MNRDEKICPSSICNGGSLFERDKSIAVASHYYIYILEILFEFCLEPQRNIKDQLFLYNSSWTESACIVTAMTRVDDYTIELEPQSAQVGERALGRSTLYLRLDEWRGRIYCRLLAQSVKIDH